MSNTYFCLLKLIQYLYDSKTISFHVNTNWSPVTITYKNNFAEFDYLPLSVYLSSNLLKFLTPINDTSRLENFSYWSKYQERAIGKYIRINGEIDNTLDDFFWNKTGSFFLKKNELDEWIVDFSYMEHFPVKSGYYNYGGLITFNNNGQIQSIKYLNQVYQSPIPYWLELVIRSTVSIICIGEVHLLRIHLQTAQKQTLNWRNYPNNKYINLYQVITFNTLDVNRESDVLIPILRNLFALNEEGFDKFTQHAVKKGSLNNFQIYGYKGTSWYNKMKNYSVIIEKLLNNLYECVDENILCYILATSAGHNQFGDAMINNLVVNGSFPPKVRLQKNLIGKISYQEYLELQTLAVLVSNRLPLWCSNSWYQHFQKNQQKFCENFSREIAEQVQDWFSPAQFEISVGV